MNLFMACVAVAYFGIIAVIAEGKPALIILLSPLKRSRDNS